MPTMIDKGDEYVARWPHVISNKAGLSTDWLVTAMQRAGVLTGGDREAEHRVKAAFSSNAATPEVGAFTPETAMEVIGHLRDIKRELAEEAKTSCWCCGLALRDGECPACGEV